MDAMNLLLPDGRPSKVWACGVCGEPCEDETHAIACCGPVPCRYCGKPTDKKMTASYGRPYEYHEACWIEDRDKRAARRMAEAEKLESWDGPVWIDGGPGESDEYYETFAEYLRDIEPESWNAEGQSPYRPQFVYLAMRRDYDGMDAFTILEHESEDKFEDFLGCVEGKAEFRAAVQAFNEANKDLHWYEPDYTRAVRVPRPEPAA